MQFKTLLYDEQSTSFFKKNLLIAEALCLYINQ